MGSSHSQIDQPPAKNQRSKPFCDFLANRCNHPINPPPPVHMVIQPVAALYTYSAVTHMQRDGHLRTHANTSISREFHGRKFPMPFFLIEEMQWAFFTPQDRTYEVIPWPCVQLGDHKRCTFIVHLNYHQALLPFWWSTELENCKSKYNLHVWEMTRDLVERKNVVKAKPEKLILITKTSMLYPHYSSY